MYAIRSYYEFDGTIRDGARNITVDVDNTIFNEPDAVNEWEQGPGVDSLELTFVMEEEEITMTLGASGRSADDYTQAVKEVSGVITSYSIHYTKLYEKQFQ